MLSSLFQSLDLACHLVPAQSKHHTTVYFSKKKKNAKIMKDCCSISHVLSFFFFSIGPFCYIKVILLHINFGYKNLPYISQLNIHNLVQYLDALKEGPKFRLTSYRCQHANASVAAYWSCSFDKTFSQFPILIFFRLDSCRLVIQQKYKNNLNY